MISIDIRIPDLGKLGSKVDLEEMLDEAAAFLVQQVLTRFMSETDPQGSPWIPSKAGMARRLKGGTGTLFDTGRLYRSLQVYKDAANTRRIGTDTPYAQKLQLGFGNQPARPFLGFNSEDESRVRQIVELRIAQMIKG